MAIDEETRDVASLYRFDTRAGANVRTLADITEKDIGFYRRQGYLVVEEAFTPSEVQCALDALLDLIGGARPDFTHIQFEAWAGEDLRQAPARVRQDYVRKIHSFVEYDSRLLAIARHVDLRAALEKLLGKEPELFQDMALLKPPGGGREKPWHQDNAYFNLKADTPVVGVWIALDPVGAANGCMHVLPGTHLEGPVVHFKRRDWQICDSEVQTHRDVYVPLAPGGALIFDGLIHHGTAPNTSSLRRRALQFHYSPADAVRVTLEDRLAVFGSEGKDAEC